MKKSKAILLALCALLLVAASVMGTLAYLTSTATVTNTFTVGKVEITLDEAKVNVNGQKLDVEGDVYDKDGGVALAPRVQSNDYKLMPGHEYVKDPVIHVAAGSSDCFLFVKVDNQIADIEGNPTVHAQMVANGWAPVQNLRNVYVYADVNADENGTPKVVSTASDKATDVDVFANFTIADDVNDEMTLPTVPGQIDPSINTSRLSLYNGSKIIVTAYAVQADGFTDKTAAEIWTAANFS